MATERIEGSCGSCTKDTKTRDWYAWLDLMPPTPDHLHVIGEVYVSNPGIKPMLVFHEPQGINPRILMLDLLLRQRPGVWPQVFVWRQVRYDKTNRNLRYDQVDILCGGEVIASIPVEEVH